MTIAERVELLYGSAEIRTATSAACPTQPPESHRCQVGSPPPAWHPLLDRLMPCQYCVGMKTKSNRNEQIASLVFSGEKLDDVANMFGITKQRVNQIYYKSGGEKIERTGRHVRPDIAAAAAEIIANPGFSCVRISAKHGVVSQSVLAHLRRIGFKRTKEQHIEAIRDGLGPRGINRRKKIVELYESGMKIHNIAKWICEDAGEPDSDPRKRYSVIYKTLQFEGVTKRRGARRKEKASN